MSDKEIVERVREDTARTLMKIEGYNDDFIFDNYRDKPDYKDSYGISLNEWLGRADKILSHKNIAIIDPDAELPDIEDYCQRIQGLVAYDGRMTGYRVGQEEMGKAGWVKGVKPE